MKARPAPSVSGDIADTSVAQVLWQLRERGLSGTLALQVADGELRGESLVVFERGDVAQVKLARTLDPLGRVLLDEGAIDAEQLDESLARLSGREGLQGEILVAMGACDEATVERALTEQLRRKLARLCGVDAGTFAYFSRIDLLPGWGGARRPEDPARGIWRGLRAHPRQRAVDALLSKVGTQAIRLRVPPSDLAVFGFEPSEQAAVELLREGATGAMLVRSGCDPLAVRALVFLLALTKRIELVAARSSAAPAPAPSSGMRVVAGPEAAPAPVSGPAPRPSARPSARPPRRPSQRPPSLRPPQRASRRPPAVAPAAARRVSSEALPAVRHTTTAAEDAAARMKLADAETRLAAMQDENWFQMLGVAPEASGEEVRAAFVTAAGRWHPDTVPPSQPKLRAVHEKIAMMLNEAHAGLGDDAAREAHRQEVAQGSGTPNARLEAATMLEAAEDAMRAEACLRKKEYADAERLARSALEVNRDDVGAMVVLASALLETHPAGPFAEVQVWLARALDLSPDNDRAHVLLGWVYQRQGDNGRALGHFVRALETNPQNIEARREVRLAEIRRRSGVMPAARDEREGFFARLFKR